MKIKFFKWKMLNRINKKYLVKTIGSKLQYVNYGPVTNAIANLISLANIWPRVKSHFYLPSSFVLWSYRKKIMHAMCCKYGSLLRKSNLYFIALTGGSVSLKIYHSLGFFKSLAFITCSYTCSYYTCSYTVIQFQVLLYLQ